MTYSETRSHELRKRRIMMVDGNLTMHVQSVETGASARVYDGGYWGFASTSATDAASVDEVAAKARRNARAMARFGARSAVALPGGSHRGEHVFEGKPPMSQKECVDRLAEMTAFCRTRFPDLKSTRFILSDEHHAKRFANSFGSDVLNSIQRALCYVTFTIDGKDGAPVELFEALSCKGSIADLDLSVEAVTSSFED